MKSFRRYTVGALFFVLVLLTAACGNGEDNNGGNNNSTPNNTPNGTLNEGTDAPINDTTNGTLDEGTVNEDVNENGASGGALENMGEDVIDGAGNVIQDTVDTVDQAVDDVTGNTRTN